MLTPLRSAALALPLVLLLAATAHAGPPWMSVEYPVNPHDRTTRGALAVVHTYHHGAQVASAFSAEAVGIIDGRRTTVRLEVTATSRHGAYAVRGNLPAGGDWVLVVSRQNPDGREQATALIALTSSREIVAVQVPHDSQEGGRWLVPRNVTPAEIDALLRRAVAMSAVGREVASNNEAESTGSAVRSPWLALTLLLVPAGVWAALRKSARRGRAGL